MISITDLSGHKEKLLKNNIYTVDCLFLLELSNIVNNRVLDLEFIYFSLKKILGELWLQLDNLFPKNTG